MTPTAIVTTIAIVLLIISSAAFSATETAFSSLNIIRIKQKAKKGNKSAKIVYKVANNYSALLTTILICNNIVNILATSLSSYLFSVEFNLGASGIGYATIMMALLIIIFGEISPKIVARQNAENIAQVVAKPISILIVIFKPIAHVVTLLEKKLKKNKEDNVTATESELLEIIQTIEFEGVLNQDERELIESAIYFDDKKAGEVMTEKDDVTFIYDDAKLEDIKNTILDYKYSRIPVVSRKTGEVIGILHEADVLESIIKGEKVNAAKRMKDLLYISSKRRLPAVLEKIQKSKAHMAIVVDNLKNKEFIGIVTLEDVLEELVGEIYDEYDDLPENVVEIGHHSFEIDPNIDIDDFFKKYVDDVKPPKLKVQTFSGWLKEMNGNDKFHENEEFVYENIVMKVAELQNNNIVRLDIKVLSKEEEEI